MGVSIVAIVIGLSVIVAAISSSNLTGSEGAVLPTGAPSAPTATASASDRSIEPATSALGIITPAARSPANLEDGRAIGRPDAPATLTVWEDFQCPFCGEFTRKVEPRLFADYVVPGKLRIVFRDWVFIGVESVAAAVAARCAGAQGQFWAYHDYLMWNQQGENNGGFRTDRLEAMAEAVGLDLQAFDACTQDKTQIAAVRAETEAGNEAKIGMTPTLVMDDSVMPGAPTSEADYARLRVVIDASIAAHTPGQVGASLSSR